MPAVSSSNLKYVEYDAERRELTITFKSNASYLYSDVPPSIYMGLMAAGSKGRYFWQNIRNSYAYRRL